MTTDTRGVSALLLQRQLGSPETAWLITNCAGRWMPREPLHGTIEVDDSWVGGRSASSRWNGEATGRASE